MEPVVEIPEPTSQDSETVATALETAALFSARGDTAEALRWLQRAAESAGDAGDDARTLTLARSAAEVSRLLRSRANGEHEPNESSSVRTRHLPKAPPRITAPLTSRPPPPSSRGHAAPSSPSHAPPSSPVNAAPSSPSHAPPSSPVNAVLKAPSHVAASAASVVPTAMTSAASARPISSSNGHARSTSNGISHAPRPSGISARPSSRSPLLARDSLRAQAPRESVVPNSASDRATQPTPAPVPSLLPRSSANGQRLRQAARVSVVASPTEPGLFLVRVLEDGGRPPVDAGEGLLVLVDPDSTLFSG